MRLEYPGDGDPSPSARGADELEFRVKWPRGELGALPDDAEQNMRLLFIEKQVGKHEELMDEIDGTAR